ncbi:helix-turn-helix domain-containing protein [Streptomyces anulatus]
MSRPRSGPTVALRLLAASLRTRREAAGVTLEDAARSLGVHTMTLSRLELARTVPRWATVSHLLRLYTTPEEEADAVLKALAEAKEPGWWHPWRDVLPEHMTGVIDLESEAELIRVYAPGVVPELLQTPEYARALLHLHHPKAGDGEIERRLQLLRERQQHVLHRPGRPAVLWALIEDAVLRRPIGGRAAMSEQIDFLDRYTRDRSSGITIQVIRAADGGHPLLLSGPASILRYTHPALDDRLITRGLHSEAAALTEDPAAVSTYLAAMDETAALAPPPTSPLPHPAQQERKAHPG